MKIQIPLSLLAALVGGAFFALPAYAQIWIQTSAPTNGWPLVACSADGARLLAVNGYSFYTSTNFGTSWASNVAPMFEFCGCEWTDLHVH